MADQYLQAGITALDELLAQLSPRPRKILVIRCAPPAMFDPLLRKLDTAIPGAELAVLCHRDRSVDGRRCIIYNCDGFFRAEHAPLRELKAEKFDLAVLPYATDRRDAPFYHEVDRIALASGAKKMVITYRDGVALEADSGFFERKELAVVRPWLASRERAVGEICAFTGEQPDEVLEKCEMAGLRAVKLWQETGPQTEQQVREYYGGNDFYVYELIKTEYNGDRREILNAVLAECEPGVSVVDYGGGVGIFTIPLAEKGCRVTHLDLPGPLLDFAGFRFRRRGLDATLLAAVSEEPLEQSYEIILSVFVVEHLVDPQRTLAHLERHLAPGGKMLLAVDFEDRREADELLPLHLTHLERDEYYRRMEEMGLVRLRSCRELDVFMRGGEV
ncbi:MAG: class I SAM-dependent methyltransferase [Candidatus Glassbacteria bacterium]|nr:class I SAM-dependent methyltransferase [Candidatus Glassbacteria bacterium]